MIAKFLPLQVMADLLYKASDSGLLNGSCIEKILKVPKLVAAMISENQPSEPKPLTPPDIVPEQGSTHFI